MNKKSDILESTYSLFAQKGYLFSMTDLSELAGMGDRLQLDREIVRFYTSHAAEAIPAVLSRLQQAAIPTISLTLTQPTLDDVFLQVTGHRLETQEMSPAPGSKTAGRLARRLKPDDQ